MNAADPNSASWRKSDKRESKSIPSCRACGKRAETISHVFQNCWSTANLRIRCHNVVLDVVKKRLQKEGYVALRELRVVSHERNQVMKPDLCTTKDGEFMILDAHVPYKTSAKQPAIARSDKIKKCAPHGDGFRRYLVCNDQKFDGVVVGAKGVITKKIAAKLSVLGLGPGEVDLIQKKRLNVHKPFLSGSWVGSCPRSTKGKTSYTRPSKRTGIDRKGMKVNVIV